MPIMSSTGFTVTVSSPWLAGKVNADNVIRQELHDGSVELMEMEIDAIRSRTPIDRGGLYASIWGIAYGSLSDRDLVYLYPDDSQQLGAWNRIYAQYQEGGLLGTPTYTNPPHEMFAQVATTDIPQIETWAFKYVNQALGKL